MTKQPNNADDQVPKTADDLTDETEGSDLQSLEDVLDWVKALTALGVTPDAAFAGTTQIMISKMGNEAASDLADKAAENADMSTDKQHEHGKETADISHKHAMELAKAKPAPTAK